MRPDPLARRSRPASATPGEAFSEFISRWSSPHALVLLNGQLPLQDAFDALARHARAEGRTGVLVAGPRAHLGEFEQVPAEGLRDPDFLTPLSDVLIRMSRSGREPMLVFAPPAEHLEAWAAIDARLDRLGQAGPVRLCLPAPEGLPALPGPGLLEARQRHGIALAL